MNDGITYLSTHDVKMAELDILEAFDAFSKRLNIPYSLGYGTLLGAVRHRGFIPWDDDIDILVEREYYDRIVDLARSGVKASEYEFIGFEVDGSLLPFLKLVDRTVHVDAAAANERCPQYLWIDIFPVDVVPDNDLHRRLFLLETSFLRSIIKVGLYKFLTGGKTWYKRALKMVAWPAVRLLNLDSLAVRLLVNKIKSSSGKNAWTTACVSCWGPYGEGECFPSQWMSDLSEISFEGELFLAMKSSDEYLRGLYGNYMELPSEEKRVAHDLCAYRTV